MPKLTNLLRTGGQDGAAPLQELKINANSAVQIKLFTDDCEEVHLHYESHEMLRGYFRCLRGECPYCKIGRNPSLYFLLPVYNAAERKIGILRMSSQLGPNRLASILLPYLEDPKIDTKVLQINRNDKNEYNILPIENRMTREAGIDQILKYTELAEVAPPTLSSLYPKYSVEELNSVPTVKPLLDLLNADSSSSEG